MSSLIRRDLGDAGLAYINERLMHGGALSKVLYEKSRGWTKVFAPLPASLADADACKFNTGKLVGRQDVYAWLCEKLKIYKMTVSLLIEDSLARVDDPALSKNDRYAYSFNGTIVYGASVAQGDELNVVDVLKLPTSFHYNACCVMASLPPAGEAPSLDSRILDDCSLIFVGAYDRDGIVVCEKS